MAEAMFVYIMTNRPKGVLYTGVTGDLIRRVHEHRTHAAKGFTDRYNMVRLVHFEAFDAPQAAIRREKNIKHWSRAWEVALIEAGNSSWRDLWNDIAVP